MLRLSLLNLGRGCHYSLVKFSNFVAFMFLFGFFSNFEISIVVLISSYVLSLIVIVVTQDGVYPFLNWNVFPVKLSAEEMGKKLCFNPNLILKVLSLLELHCYLSKCLQYSVLKLAVNFFGYEPLLFLHNMLCSFMTAIFFSVLFITFWQELISSYPWHLKKCFVFWCLCLLFVVMLHKKQQIYAQRGYWFDMDCFYASSRLFLCIPIL